MHLSHSLHIDDCSLRCPDFGIANSSKTVFLWRSCHPRREAGRRLLRPGPPPPAPTQPQRVLHGDEAQWGVRVSALIDEIVDLEEDTTALLAARKRLKQEQHKTAELQMEVQEAARAEMQLQGMLDAKQSQLARKARTKPNEITAV